MAHVTLMTGPERRRRWGEDERRRILEAAFAPGAIVADISRQFEVSTSLIYKWRREALADQSAGAFLPAMVVDRLESAAPSALAAPAPAIVVELACGARVTIGADATAAVIKAALQALR